MWEIVEHLYLGDRSHSEDRERLRRTGITHIVNCSRELPCLYPADFEYLHLALEDPDPRFGSRIRELCEFVDRGRRSGRVLVHCTGAVSRSPATILAYLCHTGMSLPRAIYWLHRIVPTAPDPSFLKQIELHFGP